MLSLASLPTLYRNDYQLVTNDEGLDGPDVLLLIKSPYVLLRGEDLSPQPCTHISLELLTLLFTILFLKIYSTHFVVTSPCSELNVRHLRYSPRRFDVWHFCSFLNELQVWQFRPFHIYRHQCATFCILPETFLLFSQRVLIGILGLSLLLFQTSSSRFYHFRSFPSEFPALFPHKPDKGAYDLSWRISRSEVHLWQRTPWVNGHFG